MLGLTDSSQIYMVDFGLAKAFRDSSGRHMHYAESKVTCRNDVRASAMVEKWRLRDSGYGG